MSHFCIKTMILPRQAWDKHIGKAPKTEMMTTMRFFKQGESAGRSAEDYEPACQGTANCIIIDHSSAFESGLVAPFLYAA
jgi:hypothetical protein